MHIANPIGLLIVVSLFSIFAYLVFSIIRSFTNKKKQLNRIEQKLDKISKDR